MRGFPLLSLIVWTPAVAAILVGLVVPKGRRDLARGLALMASLVTFGLCVYMAWIFKGGVAGYQFVERHSWVGRWGVQYLLGIDGISVFLVVLTAFLTPICILLDGGHESKSEAFSGEQYSMLMLLLETGVIGVFCSLDLFLFFVFFELSLVPMYFIIASWGSERRTYAAIKFVLYTMLGSAFLLVAILATYFISGAGTFDITVLARSGFAAATQRWLFFGFFAAFAVKVPLFPLHTWLPDAHTEAPTGGSVLLAGILLKLGTYGFVRLSLTLFPHASRELFPLMAVLAVIGILYGAIVAAMQRDFKRLIAYSSVSHMGFIVLGTFALTSQGMSGAVLQMVNHGISTGALFLLFGMVYERRHTRLISDYGGLSSRMPVYGGLFAFTMLASIGLPGLNGFVGEFLTLLGTWARSRTFAVLGATGVIFAALYLLWAYQRVFHGPDRIPKDERLTDVTAKEVLGVLPLLGVMLLIGVYPRPFLQRIEPSVRAVIRHVEVETNAPLARYSGPAETAPADDRQGTVDAFGDAVLAPFAAAGTGGSSGGPVAAPGGGSAVDSRGGR
jgi:NADH-quinone oxidoreductase subunit M